MGVNYCAAINCHNNRKKNKDKSFFRFPCDPERSKRWVINSRREDLQKRDSKYLNNNCYICSDHFEEHFFLNDLKNRIHPHAIPTIFNIPNPPKLSATKRRTLNRNDNVESASKHRKVQQEKNNILSSSPESVIPVTSSTVTDTTESLPSFQDKEVQTDLNLSSSSPRKLKLRSKIHNLNSKINFIKANKKTQQNFHFKNKTLSITEIINSAKAYLPEKVLNFFASQMNLFSYKPKGRRYSRESQLLFLSIYFYSPRAYRFLSENFAFPHKTTLSRWLKLCTNNGPDICMQVIESLKLKVDTMNEKDRLCVLCIDEISLKPSLTYDRKSDKVIGFEDFGKNCRFPKTANSALVFMTRGIITNWKQPLGFVLTSGPCKSNKIRSLLFTYLEKLASVGLLVKTIIADQGSNFFQLFIQLGTSEDAPYFEVDDKRYYVIFDPPHLLKSVRNNLYKYNVQFDNSIASWTDIVQTYQTDSQNMFRSARKLTEKHIEPKAFSKMNVSLAAQVLSYSVAAAINLLIACGKLPARAFGTAVFCSKFDEIFDCYNSISLKNIKPLRRAFTSSSPHFKVVTDFLSWLDRCKFIEKNGKDVSKRIKCIKGWKISLKSLLLLWDDIKTNHKVSFLLTKRLNQDCLENLFGAIRSTNGSNLNPTPIQFCRAFKQIAFHLLLTSHSIKQNCENDDDKFLLDKITDLCGKVNIELQQVNETEASITTLPAFTSIAGCSNLPERNAFQYVCGFLLKKV